MLSNVLFSMVKRQDRFRLFENTVDEIRDQAPGYYKVIQHPISLSEISQKLGQSGYDDVDVVEDLLRMFDNAMIYNPPSHPVYKEAKRLKDMVVEKISKSDDTFGAAIALWTLANN
jgi:hypothetical protein